MKNKKRFILILSSITGLGIILSTILLSTKKKAVSIAIIGVADGPTSIFIAGSVGDAQLFVGAAIVILITAAYLIFRKKRRGGR